MQFGKGIVEIKEKLEKIGHAIVVPREIELYMIGEKNIEEKWQKGDF